MAKVDLLFQAITNEFHADVLRRILSQSNIEQVLASVAFVREDGVDAVADVLKAVAGVTEFFVGIRNEVTSVQGLLSLVATGARVFVVDTARRSVIFHPKIFYVKATTHATVIIGSANLTFPGLHTNVEAGAILTLNLADRADGAFVKELCETLRHLREAYPEHVLQVKSRKDVMRLFNEGRLVDEAVTRAPAITSSVRKGTRDKLKPMALMHPALPARPKSVAKPEPRARAVQPAILALPSAASQFVLIWQSHGLRERDLNVPSGSNTARTGSMLWKKGAVDNIDQRHFFRDTAFRGLAWSKDPKKHHLERAEADFQIIIKGVNYGVFRLRLSHNTNTRSRTYAQKNSMTQVHWGAATEIIAERDLLGRIMSLYRKETDPPQFLIEID